MPRLQLPFVFCLIAGCGAGGSSAPDAAVTHDGPVAIDAPVPLDAPRRGVFCGETFCDPDTTQGCCSNEELDAACSPAPEGLCLDQLTSCDGREDCITGDVCCDFGFGPGCGSAVDCVAEQGGAVVCHGEIDCTPSTPYCCDHRCAAEPCA